MKKIIFFFVFMDFAGSLSAQNASMAKVIQEVEATTGLEDEVALQLLEKNQLAWEKAKWPQDSSYAKIFHYLGRRHRSLGWDKKDQNHVKKAIEYTEKAVSINSLKRPNVSEANLANSHLNLGLLYENELLPQDIAKGMWHYERSFSIGQKYPQKYSVAADAGSNMAKVLNVTGDYEQALKVASVAENLARKSNNPEKLSSCLEKKSNALRALGRLDEAETAMKEIIQLAESSSKQIYHGNALANLAALYYEKKEYRNMDIYFDKSFEVFRKADFNYGMAMVKTNLGYLKNAMNQSQEAEKLYKEGLVLADTPAIKTRLLDNLAMLYYKQKKYSQAISYLQQAIHTFLPAFAEYSNINSNPSPKTIKYCAEKNYLLDLIENKGKVWLAQYKQAKNKAYLINAEKTFLVADQMIDLMRWEHKGTQSKLFWRNKTRSIYENAIEACYLLKDYEKAFYFFEKSRAVLLNDKLNELGAKQILSKADLVKEAQLQAKIDELRNKSEAGKAGTDKIKSELLMAENEQSDFIENLEKTNPAYYHFKYDTTTVSLKQIQQYMKPKRNTLIEYFVGDSLTYAIVVSPSSVKIQRLKFDLNEAKKYLNLCAKDIATKTELNEFLVVSNRLYQNLFAPLNVSKGHVIISQDGAFLPFEALSRSVSKPLYLLNEYAVSYTYSAQFLLKNQPSSNFWPQKSFLGVAPVQFSQKLNTLTGSAESIERIGGAYLWKNELVHLKATKNAFLNQASGHRIVQVYTHAFADSTQTEPHIYFADSALKVSDLGNASFKINLLVLSACKTGVGKVAKGEGVLSLARGFSMAGIPSTITTLWSVEDQKTYSLTELFYTFLNEGLSKDEALQKAKFQYISTHPNAAPSAWAGLVLIGDASALPSNTFWGWGLGGLVMLTILWGVWMKGNLSVKH
ncbi:CHAT domain-containing protein [Runella aurantiaca]|uniref:CHAT domain-containing protein n=1 Tax=Runella aurantiaca TaxID=2282308 RepID=A0A369I5N2_9BACT|nr:CHAT domain-containing protein [Runella aurantiaca]RDB03565.1 CHAT domain-containing protein [Runella aurantiaca]